MTSYNFNLLDLADGESGDATVSVVVGKKKKTEAAAAKLADAAKPTAQEKTKCFSYYTKLLHDSGVRIHQQDLKKLSDALTKLSEEETKLREQPAGNEALLMLWDKQQKLRQEQMKLREKEATLVQQRNAFYKEYEIPLPEEKPNNNSHGASAPGSNHNGVNGNVYNNNDDGGSCGYSDYGGNNDQYETHVCNGGEHYPQGHDERQIGRGHDHYNNNGDSHLGQTELADVDEYVAYQSKVDAEIQEWVYIDMNEPNSVADAGIQDWEYIDLSGPNNHTKSAYYATK
ncbi:unnamed protein product [Urochloa humidicola]